MALSLASDSLSTFWGLGPRGSNTHLQLFFPRDLVRYLSQLLGILFEVPSVNRRIVL